VTAFRAGASPAHITGQARQSERIECGKAGASGVPAVAGADLAAGAQIPPVGPAALAGPAIPDNIACKAIA
jgi:hypothetical protein